MDDCAIRKIIHDDMDAFFAWAARSVSYAE